MKAGQSADTGAVSAIEMSTVFKASSQSLVTTDAVLVTIVAVIIFIFRNMLYIP